MNKKRIELLGTLHIKKVPEALKDKIYSHIKDRRGMSQFVREAMEEKLARDIAMRKSVEV